jgi:hypothetical protein
MFWNNEKWNQAVSYFHLLYYNPIQKADFLGSRYIRNIGIFMEAPGFAFPLTMSLFWELNMRETGKIRKGRVFVLALAGLTTFSTNAILYGFFCFAWYLLTEYSDRAHLWKQTKKYILPVIALTGGAAAAYILYDKMNAQYGLGSFLRRLDDTYAAFVTWLENPVFGVGYRNSQRLFANYLYSEAVGASTAGLLNVLAYGGLYIFYIYLFSFVQLYRRYECTGRKKITGFLILYLLFFATSSMEYSLYTLLVTGLGCCLFTAPGRERALGKSDSLAVNQ